MKKPKILVIGDLMVDCYIWGQSERISPEAPVMVVDIKKEDNRLGGACNVAHNLIALGADVFLCGIIGFDEIGVWMREYLQKLGVHTEYIIQDKARSTTQKSRVVVSHQQVLRIDRENKENITQELEEEIFFKIKERIATIDAVVISDYNKGLLTPSLTQKIIQLAKKNNRPILCDPKGMDYSKYSGATLLTPNKKEAKEATGIQITDSFSLEKALKKMKMDYHLDISLITLSEDGIGFLDEGKIYQIPTIAREVYDVTGAGDTVIAALAFCIASGKNMIDSCEFANAAAAVVVSKIGSATAEPNEIISYLRSKEPTHGEDKIISLQDLMMTLKHQRDKKIIFTNGCFDILHRGHVKYLSQARHLGDILVVGLNSDVSVRALKGSDRPINPQDDRAFVLAGLECVDYIVIFDELTPTHLIQKIMPDVLVKGADYEGKEIAGAEYAKEVKLIEFVEGKSSTNIIQKIKGK